MTVAFFQKSQPTELLPAGTYFGTLTELKVEEQPDFNDPSQMTQRAKFVYTTTAINPVTGRPCLIFDWTGIRYGNPKATLTKRLDQMFPKLSPDQRAELQPEQCVGRKFEITLTQERTQKGDMKNVIAAIKPVRELPEPTSLSNDEDADLLDASDPFADQ